MSPESPKPDPATSGVSNSSEDTGSARVWTRMVAPVVMGLALLGVTLLASRWQADRERREPVYQRANLAADMARQMSAAIDAEVERAAELAVAVGRSRAPAEEFAQLVHKAGIPLDRSYRTVGWINDQNVCEQVWSAEGFADPVIELQGKFLKQAKWEIALRRAKRIREPQVAVLLDRAGDKASGDVLFVAPATSGEGDSPGYQGCVVARLDMATALAGPLAAPEFDGYDRELQAGGLRLAGLGERIAREDAPGVEARAIQVMNRSFVLRVRRAAGHPMVVKVGLSRWIFWGGLAASIAGAVATGYVGHRRRLAAAFVARQLTLMQSLTRTSRVISAASGTSREALDGLATTASELLRMRMASVWVLDEASGQIGVVARVGNKFRARGDSHRLEDLPGTRRCVQTGEVVIIPDVRAEPAGCVNRAAFEENGIRSAMIVPLTIEGRVIGVLFVGDGRPRPFSEADRRLAGLLGSQAGVILANLKLHEQKDAALAAQKDLTRRHEALYQIATEIFRAQDLGASLQQMADRAPALLGVDLCMVSMRVGAEQSHVVALTGNYANVVGERNSATNSNIGRVWRSKRPLVIEDGPNDPTLHPKYRHRLHVGSVMYLPLLGNDGEPIGTMTLIRHAPGPFAGQVRELATALAARAAVAIETARLHEEAREAAQTQTMLLRELNHRVKNNLASIVSLLRMNRPEMPTDALAWVNRVGERIATMARTHELFVGGNDRVDLRELVARLLPALSLIKPPGAEVRSELDAVRVELDTERAVSLAMVLNELCWNALEHGTGANGVLQIRGRGPDDGRLVLEVEDEGANGRAGGNGNGNGNGKGDSVSEPAVDGHRSMAGPARSGRGTGLRLVEGLVSRELGGRFTLTRSAVGGMIARIDIPLDGDGASGVSL